eukprot:TRINITY_DN8230_c0_g1_i7.p1 TRINITY_DN8230_c0_g1~~TRINITY_DN8230_c0_g1_i7.p1  ORF type:complete len:119 (+),score=1.47 TRINITY_DN8230_c0_g1_i7:457-813(+)
MSNVISTTIYKEFMIKGYVIYFHWIRVSCGRDVGICDGAHLCLTSGCIPILEDTPYEDTLPANIVCLNHCAYDKDENLDNYGFLSLSLLSLSSQFKLISYQFSQKDPIGFIFGTKSFL